MKQMKAKTFPTPRPRERDGQTLIIALIVLGVLLLMSFVFLGVVSRNLTQTSQMANRSTAADLAEAGVRYAHSQLMYTELGADWRGGVTAAFGAQDPDFDYLQGDMLTGGPDGKGAFSRVDFKNGRALVRVRYAPSDANVFQTDPGGPLRQPGKVRNYLVIESVGRPGVINSNDPTTVRRVDRTEQFKLIAFATTGIVDHARFIHNKDRVTRPAEIGRPPELGAYFGSEAVRVPTLMGDQIANLISTGTDVRLGGSIRSNADLVIYGELVTRLNPSLGDSILVNGILRGADAASRLIVQQSRYDSTTHTWGDDQIDLVNNPSSPSEPSLNSRNAQFRTLQGLIRDGINSMDRDGFPRSVGYLAPPSMLLSDPDTGRNRFIEMSRNSGMMRGGVNSGWYGHGRNVYVNNIADRQIAGGDRERTAFSSVESLVYDWLNPNNGQSNSGWQGPFYVPPGAYVQFVEDGFIVVRDGRAPQAQLYWKGVDGQTPHDAIGNPVNSTAIRYRIGFVGAQPYIVNSFTPANPASPSGPAVDINSASLDFSLGQPFGGVLYFEGNVRVRGTIPTDVQLTLVSGGTIYVEGSLVKGVRRDGTVLGRPSHSALMLMAREYVAINTTQFFGPSINQPLEEVNEQGSLVAYNPLRVRTGESLRLQTEFLLDRTPDAGDGANYRTTPNEWRPYAQRYREFGTSSPLGPQLILSHAMDDGPAPATFLGLDVNYGLLTPNTWPYLFASGVGTANSVTPFLGAGFFPIYGLGGEPWQRYPKLESTTYPFAASVFNYIQNEMRLASTGSQGLYSLLLEQTNELTLRQMNLTGSAANDYLLGRVAVAPHDVRIEASMFAEEGAFFVIPGPAFNPNPNDTRQAFDNRVADYVGSGLAQADAINMSIRDRGENFGTFPAAPFYGEPLDVRLTILGSISENMPPPISQQAEWIRKWGWIPRQLGAQYSAGTPTLIPSEHVPAGYDLSSQFYVPNLIIAFDPVLATGRIEGRLEPTPQNEYVRVDAQGRPLLPVPRLPVSPTLAYFGEVTP